MTMINGQTFTISTNVDLMLHLRTYSAANSLNLIIAWSPYSTLNVSTLSYATENHGDFGIYLDWDGSNSLLIMYSFTNEDIYWMYNKGNNYSPWHKLSWTVV